MKDKKTILHIIKDLGRGGAETMLVEVLKQLTEYNNIVVTFTGVNRFEEKINCSRHYCLNINTLAYLPFASFKLRRFIKRHNVDIVHSHLYWPTFLARISTPKKIPLLTTIHNFIAQTPYYQKWYMRFLDRMSYSLRNTSIIGVAEGARKQYFEFLKLKPGRSYCLYTFVNTAVFNIHEIKEQKSDASFRLATLASLTYQKNHIFLIKAFALLKQNDFELHIYGRGQLQQELQQAIDETGVRVVLMGEVKNANKLLPQYDLYVMSSRFEGFSLSVLEAMAMQVPLLLSDIPSFKEQCDDTAMFFELNNTTDFIDQLKKLAANKNLCSQLAAAAKQRVLNNFTLEHHMSGLRKIYTEALKSQ